METSRVGGKEKPGREAAPPGFYILPPNYGELEIITLHFIGNVEHCMEFRDLSRRGALDSVCAVCGGVWFAERIGSFAC